MKIRNGFVSNSSSTSFIIALPEQPDNPLHVKEMMFHPNFDIGFMMKIHGPDGEEEKVSVSHETIAGFIFGQIEAQHHEYDMGWLPNLISMIGYTTRVQQYPCEKLNDEGYWETPNEMGCDHCGIGETCPQRYEWRSHEHRKYNHILDIKNHRAAVDATVEFMEKYPGWWYYFIDSGCQTSFARLFEEKQKKIFKNIGYIALGDL
jgi:hypothetical protein